MSASHSAQGLRIRQARLTAGLTQVELAELLGVAQSAVSQWEQGKVAPELRTRIKLAAALKLRLAEVLPEAGQLPQDAFNDPQVLRLVARFVRLAPEHRAAIELIVLQLAESLR